MPSWKLALDAANKLPKTIISYLDSAKRLEAYLAAEGLPLEPQGIRALLVAERDRTSPCSDDVARAGCKSDSRAGRGRIVPARPMLSTPFGKAP